MGGGGDIKFNKYLTSTHELASILFHKPGSLLSREGPSIISKGEFEIGTVAYRKLI
jgi:hypothetical protein